MGTLAVGRIRHGAVGDMPLLDMPGGLIHLAGRVIEQCLLLLRIHAYGVRGLASQAFRPLADSECPLVKRKE
jgi:hypothetical protein